jgi:cytochrome c
MQSIAYCKQQTNPLYNHIMNKRIFAAVLVFAAFVSTSAVKAQVHHKPAAAHAKKPSAADIAAGKELFLKSDCQTCHKFDVKVVGPAYYDVQKKYPATDATYTMLAGKVIAGGSGVWGQVAMAPHASLAPADAKKIVEYIFSVKPVK